MSLICAAQRLQLHELKAVKNNRSTYILTILVGKHLLSTTKRKKLIMRTRFRNLAVLDIVSNWKDQSESNVILQT
jgi:hypothetical protein